MVIVLSVNWKKVIRRFSFLLLCFLVACSEEKKSAKEEIALVVEEGRPSIVATNFAIGALVKELVDDKVITVFDPLPAWKDPMSWTPGPELIQKMNDTQPLVFIAGQEPSWISLLSNKIKVVNLHTDRSVEFRATSQPSQALRLVEQIGGEITKTFPDLLIKSSAQKFHGHLLSYQEKWEDFEEIGEMPKGVQHGMIRPAKGLSFLALVAKNYRILRRSTAHDPSVINFEKRIIPILERSCLECHDKLSEEGDVNFELYLKESSAIHQPDLWEKVSTVVAMGQMPPEKHEEQLSEEDKKTLYDWGESVTQKWDSGEMGNDPGRTTIHRLNKNEYNYTIRDLFGLKIRPADNFPEEGGGEGGFDNNADALFLPPLLVENYFESASAIVRAVYANSTVRARYLNTRPSPQLPFEAAAQKVLKYWAARIYRKPADEKEVARLMAVFRKEFEQRKKFDEAMKMPLFAMLISPNFLYRSTLTTAQKDPYPINDFELASKLSYFLWSSMPDGELFQLAAQGKLQEPTVFEAQVKRMLLDEKSKSLGMHFGGQWFGWEELRSSANPDSEKYPEFTFQLRVLLYRESMMFFNNLVNENGSAYQLLDSDYTFLNERLANFYKISGVAGSELRRVKLRDKNRGGVLGMGSVLTATSLSLRSSPSVRGAFVLKDVLGTNLPETPMNVEQLPEDDREIGGKTFRETLVQHREDVNCRSCHGMIDPIGFGLEAFDAIGRYRTHQNGVRLDTSGVMPDGSEFSTPADLKTALLKNKEEFAKNMVKKLLTYALGRDLTPYDRPVIREISEKVVADEGSMHTAFLEVAKSYPFRHRRSDGDVNAIGEDQKVPKRRRRRKK